MQEVWVRSLGQEDSLEKEVATHSSILAWKTPWTEEPNRLQSMGSQRVGNDLATKRQNCLMEFFIVYVFYECLLCYLKSESISLSRVRLFVTPIDCSPPGSSVHGIPQARMLEWIAIPFSRDLPDPEIEPGSPALQTDSLLSKPPLYSIYCV